MANKRPSDWFPFFMEFMKFSAGFAVIIVLSLLLLRFTGAGGQVAAVAKFW